jgi:hypothetical protein
VTGLIEIVRRARRRLHTLTRILDTLETSMAPDRDLATTILAALPEISAGIAAKDAKIASLTQQLSDAGVAAAADAQDDAAAWAPVGEAVEAIRAALAASPITPDQVPDTIPVEDVPAVLDQATPVPASDGEPAGPDSAEALPDTQSGDTPA